VCEYLASDLVFADGSSLDTLPPPQPAPPPTKKKAEKMTVGSKVEVTKDYATHGDAGKFSKVACLSRIVLMSV
jgi:hypothetical protein